MTEEEARRHAEGLAFAMGITFHVVRTRDGDFLPLQTPPDDCEIVGTFEPPAASTGLDRYNLD